jgi:UTP:GlnB (protein PII) uridylyltransferase
MIPYRDKLRKRLTKAERDRLERKRYNRFYRSASAAGLRQKVIMPIDELLQHVWQFVDFGKMWKRYKRTKRGLYLFQTKFGN